MFDFFMWWEMIPLTIRKIIWLVVGVSAIIGLPIAGFLTGESIVEWNVAGRSSWRSEADARAAQWDWPLYLTIAGLVIGAILLIIAILYQFTKADNRSVWR